MRRGDVLATMHSHIRVPHVIPDDQQDVRSRGCSLNDPGNEHEKHNKKTHTALSPISAISGKHKVICGENDLASRVQFMFGWLHAFAPFVESEKGWLEFSNVSDISFLRNVQAGE